MSSRLYKILLILGTLFVIAAIPAIWLSREKINQFFIGRNAGELEVDFLDVGQGDAILIKTPAKQNILIDGGPDSKVVKRLAENLPFWERRIDLMILTHPHDDHVAGLIDVIKRYDVGRIAYTGVVGNSPNYLAWLKLIRDRKIPLTIIDRPQKIILGEKRALEIIYPRRSLLGEEAENLNNTSVVARLVFGETKFLLTGDIEEKIEQELLNANIDLIADVYKAGHHGSDTSNSEKFLVAVKPKIAVISVGRDNKFGHPSRRTLKRLERTGAKVRRTDLEKTIRLISDGEKIFQPD